MSKNRNDVVEYKAGQTNNDAQYKAMGWKGFEKNEPESEPNFVCGNKEKATDNELDMTSMVDVTFLLLIFFMVTASFILQKSIAQPPAASDEPGPIVLTPQNDFVEVAIDQNNTYFVTSGDEAEIESPSERDMRARVKDAIESEGAVRLIIRAHVNSKHHKVVTAYDAGVVAGIEDIEIKTTTDDF